jgi:hypothetical protein
LKVSESPVIADLMLRGVDEAGWKKAIYDDNVLQIRSRQLAGMKHEENHEPHEKENRQWERPSVLMKLRRGWPN